MTLRQVAIVGRPNVGKSSLLNRLCGRMVSIVEPTAGVTRDRIAVVMEHGGRRFELVDTGGLGLVDEALLKEHVEAQIQAALHGADLVLFVVDGKEGRVPTDDMVARRLRSLKKPVLLVVNKVESHGDENALANWLALGFGEPLGTSAKEGYGTSDLKDRIVAMLPDRDQDELEPEGDVLKFAVVGKRNSGKSTLINWLAGEERVIVSEIPGTTRDAVDVSFTLDGQKLLAIDTAGVRKKSSVQDAIEFFSHSRSTAAIRRADVVIHLFDIREQVSQVDKALAAYCLEHHKTVVLVGNKIDLAPEVDLARWDAYLKQQLPGLDHAPVAFVSAQQGTNVVEMLRLLYELRQQSRLKIPTAKLNEVLHAARDQLMPQGRGTFPKIFYGTQIGNEPLSVLVFVNEPRLFRGVYERFLAQRLRDAFRVPEIPIRIAFRRREKVVLDDR